MGSAQPSLTQTTKTPAPLYFKEIYQGRINLRNFWVSNSIFSLIFLLLLIFIGALSLRFQQTDVILALISLIILLTSLAFFILPLHVRRLHDFNQSGWWLLFYLIPGAAGFLLLILSVVPGDKGGNKFGDQPLPRINFKEDIFRRK